MKLETLQSMITTDIDKTIKVLDNYNLVKSIKDALDQYIVSNHKVYDRSARQDKEIKGENEKGETVNTDVVKVARLGLPMQKKIVLIAAAFLGIPELEASPDGETEINLLKLVKKVLSDNKLDYKFKTIAKYTMSEKQCAELWYTQEADAEYWTGYPIRSTLKSKFRVKILAGSLGDKLIPVYDSYGDMIAFCRGYQIKDKDETGAEVSSEHFDVYTADRFYFSIKDSSSSVWKMNIDIDKAEINYKGDGQPGIPNVFKKIPVIYYYQPCTDWDDVQHLIERLETKISNHADTNDYYDSPIVFAEGEVKGFSNKGQQGKVLQGDAGAKVSYLTWNNAPESMKMEIENLLKFINNFTHTPDISLDNMKGFGQFTGIAIKMLFLDAHLKASDKEEVFGEGVQRRFNYIKNAISVLDNSYKVALKVDIKPKFNYFLPENVQEKVDILVKAVEAKILSNKTAIALNPLVTDSENEEDLIKAEVEAAKTSAPDPTKP